MRVGAHISSAGGPEKVFARAEQIGAEAIQLFVSPPQQWRSPKIGEEVVAEFRKEDKRLGLPVFFHGIYLINLGTQDEKLLHRSIGSLQQYVEWAGILGVEGTIFHVGSHKGAGFAAVKEQICLAMLQVLEAADNESMLLIENNAGQGNGIGSTFSEIGEIIRGCDGHPRIGVCLDTCHAFAMGYDITQREGCELAMTEFDQEIGLDRLRAVHANDSKMPLGGVRDRHENIGDGHMGIEGFKVILSHAAFREVPLLLEVPGIEGDGPDRENVNRLKLIREEVGAQGVDGL
ncbi:MAG: hypothetical protein CL897_03380 [Dehalococcoidia bacterium]|nr:hypothetical protein [Dehalococcoidia bacterium]HCV00259.1 hypothetical protein [Dehalococcoidia bacterium]|tara:strand:+ start:1496 stop:2365 length:870 start_codon:yes stop_codon:yes gene_type:complete